MPSDRKAVGKVTNDGEKTDVRAPQSKSRKEASAMILKKQHKPARHAWTSKGTNND